MNKNEKPNSIKGRGAAVGLVVCFVAVIVMVGTYTFNRYQKNIDQQIAKSQELTDQLAKEKSAATTANDIVLPKAEGTEKTEATETETETTESTTDESAAGAATGGTTSEVYFSEDSLLAWPASGAVLLNFSMDKTVYFSTLDQYKYNPALIIGGQVDEQINASAAGIVTAIDQTAETGVTVTLDMGNGYSAIYGQLKEVSVQNGQYVEAGSQIGYLSEPTKYYITEGANLYFEVTKDGTPINPMNFMEQ